MRRSSPAPAAAAPFPRTREIQVTKGDPPDDNEIQINRLQVYEEHPRTPVGRGRSSTIYEVPATPTGNRGDNVPRLNLSTKPTTAIYEVPPTPPGHEHRNGGKRTSVREISVGDKPMDVGIDQQAETTSDVKITTTRTSDQPSSDSKPTPDTKPTPEGPGKPVQTTPKSSDRLRTPESSVQKYIQEPIKPSVHRVKRAESSLMDFSLFLIKNASMREQIRNSRNRDVVPVSQAVPDEELQTLLRKWEKTQAEETEELERPVTSSTSVSVLPMFPTLHELPLLNYINYEGKIKPEVEPDTIASVYAVYDRLKKVHYIGITKNITNALRKLMGRRPGFCYYYKLFNYPDVENPQPQALKHRWIAELGYTPVGNMDSAQRKLWEKPVDAGPCGDRLQAMAAAIQRAKKLIQTMVERGLKEVMVYDPALMEFGKCDVLEMNTPAEAPKGKHTVVRTPYGGSLEYYICYNKKRETNFGWEFDVSINKESEETRHMVTCEKENLPSNLTDDGFLELVIGFLLHKRIPRDRSCRNGFQMTRFSTFEVLHTFDDFKNWLPK